jgi:uncharacterized protein
MPRGPGPVDNSRSPAATLHSLPFGSVVLTEGLLSRRQEVNRERALWHGLRMLNAAGNLDNLRSAAAGEGAYRGPVFMDSDVYKWLEAIGWELGRRPDADLEEAAAQAITAVEAAQAADGYLDSYYQVAEPGRRWSDLPQGHELYCLGHLTQAAVALSRACGNDRLLGVAERAVAHVRTVFGEGKRLGVDGHPEVETALVELFRHTRNKDYLELAEFFLDHRGAGLLGGGRLRDPGYFQDRVPIRDAEVIEGHAVRATYLQSGIVDVYLETGDAALFRSSRRQWQDMVDHKQYLTGGIGSRRYSESFGKAYELPADAGYAETCAAIGSFFWNWRMLLATGDGTYTDLMERTLYNGILPGMGLDGTRYFYENPLSSTGSHQRQEWYRVACCPPNLMRLLASIGHYAATQTATGVQLHLYDSYRVNAPAADGPIVLEIQSAYPWDGDVQIRVVETPERPWDLSLRLPRWCRSPQVTVEGREVEWTSHDGYAVLSRTWRPGELATLTLPMAPTLVAAHPYVESARHSTAITRGPVVYCVEACDQAAGVDPKTIAIDTAAELRSDWQPALLGGAVTVTARGYAHDLTGWTQLYRPLADAAPTWRPVQLTAVPYFLWGNREPGGMSVWIPIKQGSIDKV